MAKLIHISCLVILFCMWDVTNAQTVRYLDDTAPTGCSTPTDTDYDPTANAGAGGCGAGPSFIRIGAGAMQAAVDEMSGGDILVIRGGTYTNAEINRSDDTGLPSGTAENWTTIKAYNCEQVTLQPPASHLGVVETVGDQYIQIGDLACSSGDPFNPTPNIHIDGNHSGSRSTSSGVRLGALNPNTNSKHLRIYALEIEGMYGQGLINPNCDNCSNATDFDLEIIGCKIWNNGHVNAQNPGLVHNLYLTGSGILLEDSMIYDSFDGGWNVHAISGAGDGSTLKTIVRNNWFPQVSSATSSGAVLANHRHMEVYNNVVEIPNAEWAGIRLSNSSKDVLVYNNTIINTSIGIKTAATPSGGNDLTGAEIRNNIIRNSGVDSIELLEDNCKVTDNIIDQPVTDEGFGNIVSGNVIESLTASPKPSPPTNVVVVIDNN